jgi:hypothetical protein
MASSNPPALTLGGAAFLLFITLKLTHVIDWSWWWLLVPALLIP